MGNKDCLKVICPKCGWVSGIYKDYKDTAKCYHCETHPIATTLSDYQYDLMTTDERKQWDALMREKYTLHSDIFDEELYQKTLEGDFERQLDIDLENREKTETEANTPKCPTCGSTNIRHIGGVERGASVIGLGLFSGKIGKNYECLNCKARW